MKFDMHCHVREGSIDSHVRLKEWIAILQEKGFGGMLITDHDSYRGYKYWKRHREDFPEDFVVLKGIEYDTRDAGHFLVIMPDDVDLKLLKTRGMRIEMLTRLVHHYCGILGPAHPFGMRSSSAMFFKKLKQEPELMAHFDFVEGLNTCELPEANEKARELAETYDLPMIAGSDAHRAQYVGTAFTDFDREITCNNDLIAAIREGGIAIGGKEREFLKKHKKRYWLATTLGFIALNRTLSLAHKPYRRRKAHKLGLYHMDKDGNR